MAIDQQQLKQLFQIAHNKNRKLVQLIAPSFSWGFKVIVDWL
jgi:hypothetical protein